MCFLKFVLSFLVVGDHNTVADILQHKGKNAVVCIIFLNL